MLILSNPIRIINIKKSLIFDTLEFIVKGGGWPRVKWDANF